MRTSGMEEVSRTLLGIRATPAVFDLNNYSEPLETGHSSDGKVRALVIYGFLEDYSPPIKKPFHLVGKIEVQGMI